jgi:hypothetical protein
MMKLHATVGFEDERLTQFRMVFPDDSVERDLHIFRHAKLATMALAHEGRAAEMLLNSASDDVGRRAALGSRLSIDARVQVKR